MTERQQLILTAFQTLERQYRRRPFLAEMAEHTGLTVSTIHRELERMSHVTAAVRYFPYRDHKLYNGPLSRTQSVNMGFGRVGCPYRGSLTCLDCPFEPIVECEYKCDTCAQAVYCDCSRDQTEQLAAWGLVE